ncbi:MAG: hypothetical protein AB1Z65_01175 [Candidatus Sulfomarinibacteraceae bacterium]|nr:hypothetical protein [Candidatus Sulfomarinibacteraceae bacterium]
MKFMVKAAIGFLLVVGVVVALSLTRPDEASFKRWAKANIPSESGSVVEQAKGIALTTQAKWTADYEDHVLWATVDAYQGGTEQRFVGVMGTWFPLGGE